MFSFFISFFAIQPLINHRLRRCWLRITEKFDLIVAKIALFICVITGNTANIHQLFVEHSAEMLIMGNINNNFFVARELVRALNLN